jgi:hypothetical protein
MEKLKRIEPFERLSGNVKGLIDVELSRFTAFTGTNRTGKTAHVDAIRLALTGEHPCGPHGSDLMELAPEGATSLSSVLEGPSGRLSFTVLTENGKAKKPQPPGRDGLLASLDAADFEHILPAQSLAGLISLGSDLGREAIFKRFGEIEGDMPSPRGLTPEQQELWDIGTKEVKAENPKADMAEVLSGLAAWMRSKKLALGREIKPLERSLKEREGELASTGAGGEQVDQWKRQLEIAKAWEDSEGLRNRQAAIEAEAQAYREKVTPLIEEDKAREHREVEFAEEQKGIRQEIGDLESELGRINEALRDGQFWLNGGEYVIYCEERLVGKRNEEGLAPCYFCGGMHDPKVTLEGVRPRVEERRESIERMIKDQAEMQAKIKAKTEELYQRESEWQQQHTEMERLKGELRAEHARISSARNEINNALKDAPESYEGPTVAELQQRISKYEDVERINEMLDRDAMLVEQKKVAQQMAKTLEQQAAKLLNTLLVQTADTAHAAVNKYMPEGFRAQLDLEKARWNVIGLDGRPHRKHIMAGSEEGMLIPALALAWTEGAPGRFIILEDKELQPLAPENVKALCDALNDALDDGLLTQVFVTTTRPHELPEYIKQVPVGTQAIPQVSAAPQAAEVML